MGEKRGWAIVVGDIPENVRVFKTREKALVQWNELLTPQDEVSDNPDNGLYANDGKNEMRLMPCVIYT